MRPKLSRRDLLVTGTALASIANEPATAKAPDVPMKLGMISYNVGKDWDLPTLIHHAKAAGLAGLELRTTHAHGVEPTIGIVRRREVRQMFADAGLTLWGLGTVCEFESPDPAVVKENVESCKRWCELGHDVGAHGVKVRPNGLPKGAELAPTLAQIGTALHECGDVAAAAGVEIFLEVHGSVTQNPPNIRTILDHCKHPAVGACWNSNATDVLNGSVKTYFNLLRPDIKSCHINDLWDERYPYRELFKLFRQSGYSGFTLCEVAQPFQPDDGLTFLKCYRGLWNELCKA